MPIKVYRAACEHLAVAYDLVQEYYEAASVVAREDGEEFAREYFGDGAGVWLAENDGNIVGCAALRTLKEKRDCGEIKRLYVRPSYRGQGIADLLFEALESYARKFGYLWLYLDTASDMKAAARFYERKGFLPCERYNNNPQAAIFMRKTLRNDWRPHHQESRAK
jgi:GNAT superfamily N-acetyltransferase